MKNYHGAEGEEHKLDQVILENFAVTEFINLEDRAEVPSAPPTPFFPALLLSSLELSHGQVYDP